MVRRKKRYLIISLFIGFVALYGIGDLLDIVTHEFPAKETLSARYGKIEKLDLDWMGRNRYNVDITLAGQDYTYFYWSPEAERLYEELAVGDTARIWVDPEYSRNVWQIEHRGRFLRSYEDIIAYQNEDNLFTSLFAIVFCAVISAYFGIMFWASGEGKPAPIPPKTQEVVSQ